VLLKVRIVLDTPQTSGNGNYTVQIALSWDKCNRDQEPPAENSARVAMVKQLMDSFASPLKDIIHSIPDDTFAMTTKLGDWTDMRWDNRSGRVTLVGDAAHAMTMCKCFFC
jgi:2-polyprenyl-6-methoxyphenol hydroxylase-like FAD-dependent oxidoreductase